MSEDKARGTDETNEATETTAEDEPLELPAPTAPWTLQIRPDGSVACIIREEQSEEAHVVKPGQVVRALRKLIELAREA